MRRARRLRRCGSSAPGATSRAGGGWSAATCRPELAGSRLWAASCQWWWWWWWVWPPCATGDRCDEERTMGNCPTPAACGWWLRWLWWSVAATAIAARWAPGGTTARPGAWGGRNMADSAANTPKSGPPPAERRALQERLTCLVCWREAGPQGAASACMNRRRPHAATPSSNAQHMRAARVRCQPRHTQLRSVRPP